MEKSVLKKIKRAKLQANDQHPDYKRIHPDEARDAAKGQYTLLTQRVKKEIETKQKQAIDRRLRRIGK